MSLIVGEENKNKSDPTKLFILEDEVIDNIDDGEGQAPILCQRCTPRKQMTRNFG